MIQVLFGILYITLVSWSWGIGLCSVLKKSHDFFPDVDVFFICLLGLSLIGISCMFLSLFFAMGSWPMQFFIWTPFIIQQVIFKNTFGNFLTAFKSSFASLNKISVWFFFAALLFITIPGLWYIIHPDTVSYHAPIIKWIYDYPVIPGLANLNNRIGLQSSWFVLCSIFTFEFMGIHAITFLNTTILSWFVLFLAAELSRYTGSNRQFNNLWLWIILCFTCFGVITQIPVTAISTSPDFIICIFTWAGFYLILNSSVEQSKIFSGVIAYILLSFSLTLKLSALPTIMALLLINIQLKGKLPTAKNALLILIPLGSLFLILYRTYITSGYLMFPANYFNYFDSDWKVDSKILQETNQFVTTYARVGDVEHSMYAAVIHMKFMEWFPYWWSYYTILEKLFTVAAAVGLLTNLIFFRSIYRSNKAAAFLVAICCVSATALMIKAPAPRFSQAYLVPIILSAAYIVSKLVHLEKLPKLFTTFLLAVLFINILYYDAYRIYKYFDRSNIWAPYGIPPKKLAKINCKGMNIYLLKDSIGCGTSPLPCVTDSCINFFPRGKSVLEGFNSKVSN